MFNRYTFGWLIAVAAVSLSFLAGASYNKHTADRPCIRNYHSTSFPWFGNLEQKMLENTDPYDEDSDFAKSGIKSPSAFIKRLIELERTDQFALNYDRKTEIFANEKNGKEFIVPANCYIGEVDYFGEPILYRR